MAWDGRQGIRQVMSVEGGFQDPLDGLRESDLLSSLRKQNAALDHLRRALDGDDVFDDDASLERERIAAALTF